MSERKVNFGSSIGGKLILISSLVILLAMGVLTVIALTQMSSAIHEEAFAKLEAIHAEKENQLASFFTQANTDANIIAESLAVRTAIEELIIYHNEMGITALTNYDITGESEDLTKPYSQLYDEIYDNLHNYNDISGYYDIFLICKAHGHVMYTNAQESDLGENLNVGDLRDSGLAKLWKTVVDSEQASIVDLAPYAPSNGAAAMFMGAPVYTNGNFTAVAAVQVNIEKINEILQTSEETGMGTTGQVYAVGQDLLMRTVSRFSSNRETHVLQKLIDTPASRILEEDVSETQEAVFPGAITNEEVLSVFSPANIDGIMKADFDWALIAEINKAEIMTPVNNLVGLIIAIAFGIIVIAVVIMIFFSRSLSTPIKVGVDAAVQIASGDLDLRIEEKYVKRKDEVGMLAAAFQDMIEKLSSIVGSVLTGSEQIASASEQLASGNQDLSTRTEQQASALEETSSAIEEMNSSVKSNADNTKTADQLARDAVTKTEDGSSSVGQVISSMNEINDSSTRIAEIIEVINNIAFQTNLLALNASIEAARAGEQGKGFAVVAVEVRKLAKRSDKAASEIAEIIKESSKKVEEGVDIANKAGDMLLEINNAVKKVTTLVAEISAASQEQLSSVDEIDKTLSSLDENTQKNAALVEEAASSTEELSAQAQELNSTMQYFKLSAVGRTETPALEDKRPQKVTLLEGPSKEEKAKSASEQKSEVYQTFSGMVDEGEFDEF
jgi:methyl-accepting chemotaxis protein